jgi:hypothetical protein
MNRLDIVPDQPELHDTDVDQAPVRRVREEVRDGVAVAVTSVAASVALVLFATICMRLVG